MQPSMCDPTHEKKTRMDGGNTLEESYCMHFFYPYTIIEHFESRNSYRNVHIVARDGRWNWSVDARGGMDGGRHRTFMKEKIAERLYLMVIKKAKI